MYSTLLFYGYHIIDKNILPDYTNILYIHKRHYIENNTTPKWFHINCYDGTTELFYGFHLNKTKISKITTYTNDQFEIYDNMLKDYIFKLNMFDKTLKDFYTKYQSEKNELNMTFRRISNGYGYYYDINSINDINTIDIIDLYSDIDIESDESISDSNNKKYTYGIHTFNEICIC